MGDEFVIFGINAHSRAAVGAIIQIVVLTSGSATDSWYRIESASARAMQMRLCRDPPRKKNAFGLDKSANAGHNFLRVGKVIFRLASATAPNRSDDTYRARRKLKSKIEEAVERPADMATAHVLG